ncbi:MAG: aspartate--tRNA(Asn) ligase [Thaumarchaeota archaeon]|nr:aspartate--tRNA(Asn) ligase [Nitrososphaerota archaeon]
MGYGRTHTVSAVGAGMIGERVGIAGWVEDSRAMGKVAFLTVRDHTGVAQAVARGDLAGEASAIPRQSAVRVTGVVQETRARGLDYEIAAEEVAVLARAAQMLPIDPIGRLESGIDARLNARALDLRSAKTASIFRLRAAVLSSLRSSLARLGFTEITTPKIIGSASEGGANLFSLEYFGRTAYLAQSPQLYKEQMTMGMGSVYEIANFYRAEKSHTGRHLSEFTSVDIEAAFMDDDDVMGVLEDLVATACADVSGSVEGGIGAPSRPFERVTYAQAVDELRAAGHDISHGDDLLDSHLRVIGEAHPGFYFLTGWPTALKPFYIMPRGDDPATSHSFDLQHGHLELSSGGTRLHDPDVLRERLREQGLDPAGFGPHLESFSWGMPPHSGWGMGLDRLVALAAGLDNVREAVLYPRDPDRLSP